MWQKLTRATLLAMALNVNASLAAMAYEIPEGISVSKEAGKYSIYIKGDIRAGDATIVEEIFEEAIVDHALIEIILTDSVGGSVSDAVDIGRMARAWDSWTRIYGYCYSSCALIYVGGSIRFPAASAELGLHRPYFSVHPGSARPTTDNIDDLYGSVKAYLSEMNISSNFFDAMISVRPSDIKKIVGSLAIQEWVPISDPVYDEVSVSGQARRYGIGTIDYRAIDSFDFMPMCGSLGKAGADQMVCAFFKRLASMWGMPLEYYDKVEGWYAAASKACALNDLDIKNLKSFVAEKKSQALRTRSPKPYREISDAPERIKSEKCIIEKMRSI